MASEILTFKGEMREVQVLDGQTAVETARSSRDSGLEKVEGPFVDFLTGLKQISQVEGVALLGISDSQPPFLQRLTIEVFAPLMFGSEETADLVMRVTGAEAVLSRKVHPFARTGLRFANTLRGGLEEMKDRMYWQWANEPGVSFIAFTDLSE